MTKEDGSFAYARKCPVGTKKGITCEKHLSRPSAQSRALRQPHPHWRRQQAVTVGRIALGSLSSRTAAQRRTRTPPTCPPCARCARLPQRSAVSRAQRLRSFTD